LAGTLQVIPHEDRDWLVIAGGSSFAVPAGLGRALLPLQGAQPDRESIRKHLTRAMLEDDLHSGWNEAEAAAVACLVGSRFAGQSGQSGRRWRRALWLRVPLISKRWTTAVARRLRGLTSWPALAGMVVLGMAGYVAPGLLPSYANPAIEVIPNLVPGLLLFLVTALWHEFGHAAALARQGYAPGGIGAGLLFVIPVLFADVTALGALPRGGRVRVDVAGVCFQLAIGGLLFAIGPFFSAARTAGLFALFAVTWSLLPFIRSDGYWLLCDLLQVSKLSGPIPAGRNRGLTIFLRVFQLANALFLVLVVILAGRRLVGLAGKLVAIWGR
jgi:hypothetical protein